MTKSKTFTVAEVKALPPEKHCDGEGLWLFKAPNGRARWYFRFTLFGRQRETGLGRYPLISLAEARKKAEKMRGLVANGDDPIKLKRQERTQLISAEGRFETLVQKAYQTHRLTMKGEDASGKWFGPIRTKLLPKLGKMPITKIDQHDIYDALATAWEQTPAVAESCLSRLRVVYRYAIASGYDVDPTRIDKAKILLGARLRPRQHVVAMPWEEASAFYKRLGDVNPVELALRMLMLTGVRSAAVRHMRFDEIQGSLWTIPVENVKGKKEFVKPFRVPLSPEALHVIDLAKSVQMNGYLFPNEDGGPLDKMAMRNLLTDWKIAGRPHGFRTTVRTWLADHDVCNREVAEAVLGHFTKSKVEQAYNWTDYFQLRVPVMDAWAACLTGKD